jgi:hypothetical protein
MKCANDKEESKHAIFRAFLPSLYKYLTLIVKYGAVNNTIASTVITPFTGHGISFRFIRAML